MNSIDLEHDINRDVDVALHCVRLDADREICCGVLPGGVYAWRFTNKDEVNRLALSDAAMLAMIELYARLSRDKTP